MATFNPHRFAQQDTTQEIEPKHPVATLFPIEPEVTTIPFNPSLIKVIRHVPDPLFAIYLNTLGLNPATILPSHGTIRVKMRTTLENIGLLDDAMLGTLYSDAEQFVEMSDSLGQEAMQTVVSDLQNFAAQENAITRSLWLFLHEPSAFRRAEEIRHADYYRLGRTWDGFVGPDHACVYDDHEHRTAFCDRVKIWFRSPQVKMEIYERIRFNCNDENSRLIQAVVYREGLPDSVLEFNSGDLTRRHRRPVYEFALTYETDSGVIEVIAQNRESREEMAYAFAEIILQQKITNRRIPIREYSLLPLMTQQPFPTDPEDGIASVDVISLSLRPLVDGEEIITFETDKKSSKNIYERASEWFREFNPLTNQGFRLCRATLSVVFHPSHDARRGKVVQVRLSLPNGCNLKGKTDKERLICEKYLPIWKLVKSV
jgi:hypothetical protein